jgi:pyruvate dehydrogenase E2 component (dihydrolipoamide acetyltransferase)
VIPLSIPKLSMSGEPVRIVGWLFHDGAQISRGDPVVELETDKSTIELEAPASGILRIGVAAGVDVDVDVVIAHVLVTGVDETDAEPSSDDGLGGSENGVAGDRTQLPTSTPPERLEDAAESRVVASPAARRLAKELGVELETVSGSGPGGRIVAADLTAATAPADEPRRDQGLRKAVVASISASWREIPHVHIGGRLDAEGLVKAYSDANKAHSVTDLLIFALVKAVLEVPTLNGTYQQTPDLSEAVHLSLAVATPDGVTAPTIRNAQSLGLSELSSERERLVEAARAGTLSKRDMGGGTLTLSNLGAFPVDFFAPVISGPQICLVATGRIAQEPAARDGMIGLRHQMWVNVAIDHRAADGEAGGRLLAALERQFAVLGAKSGTQEDR